MEITAAATPAAESRAAHLLVFVPSGDDVLADGPAHAIDALLDGGLGALVAEGELIGARPSVCTTHT
ncbi:MAG: hypothetical protein OXI03_01535 [Chloroflexota bacterium]|nr:hypothetical protein [Chloroflexota bacterium]